MKAAQDQFSFLPGLTESEIKNQVEYGWAV
jgi:ribulose bisphosphate carboxylase small subunit